MALASGPLLLVAVVLAGLAGSPWAAAQGSGPLTAVYNYYVHHFDPQRPTAPMDLAPPGIDEQPSGSTNLTASGDPSIAYTFLASHPLASDTRLSSAVNGSFLVWIKPYQNDTVGPGKTRVKYHLETTTGQTIGDATVAKEVPGGDKPVPFAAAYATPPLLLPAGTILRWIVEISTDSSPAFYNPIAAPYGVSRQYPFLATLASEYVAPLEPNLRVDVDTLHLTNLTARDEAVYPITLHNDAEAHDNVTLTLERSPRGVAARFELPDGSVGSTVGLGSGTSARVLLVVTNLTAHTNEAFLLRVRSQLGADEVVELQYSVLGAGAGGETPAAASWSIVTVGLVLASFLRRRGQS